MIKNVNMGHLLSLTVQLATQGCKIVGSSYMNDDIKKYEKKANDPVTEADFKVQTMLIRGFRQHYPNIKIIGEETTDYEGQIQCDYNQFKFPFLPSENFALSDIPEEDLCIYIDPIDNTKGFINGHPEDVTILIGISNKQKAQMGVVGIPFKRIGDKAVYDPSIIVGSSLDKMAFEYGINKEEWVQLGKPAGRNDIRIATSPHRQSELQVKIIKELGGKQIRVGGAGRKIMLVVKHEVELALYAHSQTYKWDSCAPEAIVHALGGIFTSQYGEPILYNSEIKNEPNSEGLICSFDEEIHRKVIEMCLEDRKNRQ